MRLRRIIEQRPWSVVLGSRTGRHVIELDDGEFQLLWDHVEKLTAHADMVRDYPKRYQGLPKEYIECVGRLSDTFRDAADDEARQVRKHRFDEIANEERELRRRTAPPEESIVDTRRKIRLRNREVS